MMKAEIVGWLWDYLFHATPSYNYGVARIFFVVGFGYYFLVRGFRIKNYCTLPRECYEPSLPLRLLPRAIFPPPAVIFALAIPLHLLAMAGVCTRLSLLLLACWWLYLEGIHNSFGFFNHVTSLPCMILLAAPLFPGIDLVSVDRLFSPARAPLHAVPVAVWPAHLTLTLLSIGYFTAGLSKVRFGNTFLNGDTLVYYLRGPTRTLFIPATQRRSPWKGPFELETFTYNFCQQTTLGRWIASMPWLTRGICIAIFTWEITFPIVLIVDSLLPQYLVLGVAFHIGVAMTMRLNFLLYIACYSFLVDWNRVLLALGLHG